MAKYKITWNIGYGDSEEIIEAESLEQANEIAYEYWHDAVENDANYGAEEIEN